MNTNYSNNNYVAYNVPNTFQQGQLAYTGNTQPPLPNRQVRLSWWERQQKNKTQSNAIAGGLIHMFTAGMHIALGMEFSELAHGMKEQNIMFHFAVSWFIGVVLGSIISSFLVKSLQKRTIYFSVGLLTIISSLLMIIFNIDNDAILAARYIAGFAHGILLIPILTHAAEIVANEIRGQQLSDISVGISLGMGIQALLTTATFAETNGGMKPIRLTGIISLIYTVLSVIATYLFTYESPVYLISKGRDQLALTNMIKLRNESVETWEIRKDYLEMKEMVNEDQQQSSNIFSDRNIVPLFRITLLRCIYVFSISAPISIMLINLTMGHLYKIDETLGRYTLTILFAFRGITEMFAVYAIDRVGRRLLMFLSTGISGLILIIIGAICIQNYFGSWALPFLSILYFIAIGIGIGPASFTYLGEAFPLNKKPLSIFFVIFIENLLNIILSSAIVYIYPTKSIIAPMLFTTGGLSIIIGLCLYVMLPETKQLNLKECRNKMM